MQDLSLMQRDANIEKYVQRYFCGNPETQVKVKKDNVHLKCKACRVTSDVARRHKLNTFLSSHSQEYAHKDMRNGEVCLLAVISACDCALVLSCVSAFTQVVTVQSVHVHM